MFPGLVRRFRRDEKRSGATPERLSLNSPWQWLIFPASRPTSIVSAGAFHCRVRDGNGWVHSALTTKGHSSLGVVMRHVNQGGRVQERRPAACLPVPNGH